MTVLKTLGLKGGQIVIEQGAPHSVTILIEKDGVRREIFGKEGDCTISDHIFTDTVRPQL